MNRIAIATVAFVAMTSAASATDWYGRGTSTQREIDVRQDRQESRIQQGVRSGEINRREYQQLEAEQARIRELERRAKADGRVDRYEAAHISRAQNEAGRHIYQESHDRERRGNWYRRWW